MNVVRTCPRSVSILCALCHEGMLGAYARSSFGVLRSIPYIHGTSTICVLVADSLSSGKSKLSSEEHNSTIVFNAVF